MSEDEILSECKSRLQRRWRKLAVLRKQVHRKQMVPYSDALEDSTKQTPRTLPSPLDNVALKARLRFHQFRGAFVRRVTRSQMLLQFNTSCKGLYLEQFMVLLEAKHGKYNVVRASVPVSVELSKIEKKFLSEENNLLEFIQYVQACVNAYTFRKFDFIEFKELASQKFVANLRRSLNLHFVYMTICLKDKSNRSVPLSVMLKYDPDSCIATVMNVTAVSEDEEEFARQSENLLSYFLKVPLNEAFVLGVKEDVCELQLETSRNSEVTRASVEADNSRARSARRVLRFCSPASSASGGTGSEGSSLEEETSRRAQWSLVKRVSHTAASQTRRKPVQRSTRQARTKHRVLSTRPRGRRQ